MMPMTTIADNSETLNTKANIFGCRLAQKFLIPPLSGSSGNGRHVLGGRGDRIGSTARAEADLEIQRQDGEQQSDRRERGAGQHVATLLAGVSGMASGARRRGDGGGHWSTSFAAGGDGYSIPLFR